MPVEVVPVENVTLSVNLRFLANSQLLDFLLQLIDESRFGSPGGLAVSPHGCALLFRECRDGRFRSVDSSVLPTRTASINNRRSGLAPMVSRVAIAFFVGHHELLFVAFFPGRSNDNADTALKNLVAKMLSGIVLERRVILEFLGPL
jgi:hypothetical protein